MLLSAAQLWKLITDGGECITEDGERVVQPLIELPDGEVPSHNIEASGYDLTVQSVRRCSENTSLIGLDERRISEAGNIPNFAFKQYRDTDRYFRRYHLNPRSSYLVVSRETVSVPWRCTGLLSPRTSFARSGCILIVSHVNCSYYGTITALLVTGRAGLELDEGAHFCSLRLAVIDAESPEDVQPYDGVWGKGKNEVTTNGKMERAF